MPVQLQSQVRLTDAERRRLVRTAHAPGFKVLNERDTLVTETVVLSADGDLLAPSRCLGSEGHT